MNSTYNDIRDKFLEALDPNNSYTMESFKKDYGEYNENEFTKHQEIFKFPIKFINKSNNPDPQYETNGAAGFDLRANEELIIEPMKRAIVPTGLFFEIPQTLEIQVRPRSGLAAKKGITVLNSPGTIDSDYRGEVGVILINLGEEPFEIKKGDRIAQAVISMVTAKSTTNFMKVEKLNDNTERGTGGFGSTGVK